MQIVSLEVGDLGTNCYIVADEKTGKAGVIDPGGNAAGILAIIREKQLDVAAIINTHAHADHMLANGAIQAATQAPICMHETDAEFLQDKHANLSAFVGREVTFAMPQRLLYDGDVIKIGGLQFTVLHTPGHTPGGISLYCDDVVFVGDTLFAESIGRTDFPGGSYKQLIHSIKTKLMVLPDETRVLPGHGPETTIGWERRRNPFLQ